MGLQHAAYSPVFMGKNTLFFLSWTGIIPLLARVPPLINFLLLLYASSANHDDLNVVLWLNPHSPASEFSNAGSDGLRIYDESSASKLFSQGVSVYPSAHSDFLSRSSSLAIDLQARCNLSNSEFIPRAANRLVVVRAKKLCTLLTPGYTEISKKGDFERSTMIALVMVLSPSA